MSKTCLAPVDSFELFWLIFNW